MNRFAGGPACFGTEHQQLYIVTKCTAFTLIHTQRPSVLLLYILTTLSLIESSHGVAFSGGVHSEERIYAHMLFCTSGCRSRRRQPAGLTVVRLLSRIAVHGILLNRKQLFSRHFQTWRALKSMHCPHKSPHFLSIQETVTHPLACS